MAHVEEAQQQLEVIKGLFGNTVTFEINFIDILTQFKDKSRELKVFFSCLCIF